MQQDFIARKEQNLNILNMAMIYKKKPPKTGVKQIESNRKLYPYSYLLGT
jgi:hypothetical protein